MTAGTKATLTLVILATWTGGVVALIAHGFPILGAILLLGPLLPAIWFVARATFEERW